MSNIHIPPAMAIFNSALELSRKESERGLVVVLVSYIESRLNTLLGKERVLNDSIKKARKDKLLPIDLLDNLQQLREIRNIFAHEWDVDSLDHPSLKVHVDLLRVNPKLTMPPRSDSKWYVSNVLAYAASDINSAIAKQQLALEAENKAVSSGS